MPIYTVDLSCRSFGLDYTPPVERLRGAHSRSFMDVRWLLEVRDDLNTVTNALLSLTAPADRLFETELDPETR